MMAVRLGDLSAAARVLREWPRRHWVWVAARMLAEARRGAMHGKRYGRPHPRYGDGSLMAAALRRRPAAAPTLEDRRFRDALGAMLEALDAFGSCASGAQSGKARSRATQALERVGPQRLRRANVQPSRP